jgi:hypothetical protein
MTDLMQYSRESGVGPLGTSSIPWSSIRHGRLIYLSVRHAEAICANYTSPRDAKASPTPPEKHQAVLLES